jgi:hypothetical protein
VRFSANSRSIPDVGVRLRDLVEGGPVQLQELAAGEGDDARHARLAGEDRHLAEEGALGEVAELGLVARRGVLLEGAHPARGERVEASPGAALAEDDAAPLEGHELEALDDRDHLVHREVAE